MFSPAVGCGWPTAFFLFLLDKFTKMCYNIKDKEKDMKDGNGRIWLAVDSALRKLQNANHWVTSLDIYKKDIEVAIAALKEAKKKIEEEK